MLLLRSNTAKQLILLALLSALSACGGGGGSTNSTDSNSGSGSGTGGGPGPGPDSNPPSNNPPTAAALLSLGYSPLQAFSFNWNDVADADFYRLWQDPDGVSGFNQVGIDIQQGVEWVDVIVPLLERQSASYLLESCNQHGCVSSATEAVSGTLAESIGYFKASNTEDVDQFGFTVSLSTDGTTLAVGAPVEDSAATGVNGSEQDNSVHSSGAVYVFIRENNVWQQQAYIKASNTSMDDQFGYALSLSDDGNTLAVSASLEDSSATGVDGNQFDNDASSSGAVYLFSREQDVWSQQAYLKASNTQSGDVFGESVSLNASGNRLAVGAPNESSAATGIDGIQSDNSAPRSGAVYVFDRTDSSWAQTTYVKSHNPELEDYFGRSVSLSGDGLTLSVGAYGEDSSVQAINGDATNNAAESAGAVYVFFDGSGWAQQSYIKPDNLDAYDRFGWSTDLNYNGSTMVVGAYGEDSSSVGANSDGSDNAMSFSGAAYVFVRDSSDAWAQQAYIKPVNTGAIDLFGHAVSISNDGEKLAVAAYYEKSIVEGINGDPYDNSGDHRGAVYVFGRLGDDWSQLHYVKASHSDDDDEYGWMISLSGNGSHLAVGALREDSAATGVGGDGSDNTAVGSGAVYVY